LIDTPAPLPHPDNTPPAPSHDVLGRHLARLPRKTLAVALSALPIVALINIAVLVWSLGGIDLSVRLVAPQFLMLAALLVFIPMLANALRLMMWGRFLGLGLGYGRALRVMTGTMVANSVTPSAAGGMPIKLLMLVGEGVPLRRGVSLISFQAAEDALVLSSLVGLSLAVCGFAMFDFLVTDTGYFASLDQGLRSIAVVALCGVAAVGGIGWLLATGALGPRVGGWITRRWRRLKASAAIVLADWAALVRRGKRIALLSLCLALLQWSVRFSIAGLVLAAFGLAWQPALFWLLQYLVQLISSTVPTPGGVGGAEAGFVLLFAPFVERAVLFPAMSTWRLLFFYLPLTGAAAIYFVLRRQQRHWGSLSTAKPQPTQPAE
jgi:glycosyltransferase 2 family protein